MMGYKAWIGGKSRWVGTGYGNKNKYDVASSDSGEGQSYDVKDEKKYIVELPNGVVKEIPARSPEAALMLAGRGAKLISKKKRNRRGD